MLRSLQKLKRKLKFKYMDDHAYNFYSKQFKMYLQKQGIPNVKQEGEDDYLAVWHRLSDRVEPYSYRLFSRYCGLNKYIIPEDLGNSVIEYYLNPVSYRSFYSDKNMYTEYLRPISATPKVLMRRINGGLLLDEKFNVSKLNFESKASEFCDVLQYDKIVIKPSVGTCSGKGVKLFYRVNAAEQEKHCAFTDGKGAVLDGSYLRKYGQDYVIQEAIRQHPYLAQFCPTCVNTMRICAYRSVVDETVIIFAAAIRIGHKGSVVDNLHAGGGFVGIDVESGKLQHVVYDQYGTTSFELNGVNFKDGVYTIPNWKEIKNFATSIVKQNHHMHLLALDVTMDELGQPMLIEFNIGEFAFWIPMFMGKQVFGNRIEEVIDYCRQRMIEDGRIKSK